MRISSHLPQARRRHEEANAVAMLPLRSVPVLRRCYTLPAVVLHVDLTSLLRNGMGCSVAKIVVARSPPAPPQVWLNLHIRPNSSGSPARRGRILASDQILRFACNATSASYLLSCVNTEVWEEPFSSHIVIRRKYLVGLDQSSWGMPWKLLKTRLDKDGVGERVRRSKTPQICLE